MLTDDQLLASVKDDGGPPAEIRPYLDAILRLIKERNQARAECDAADRALASVSKRAVWTEEQLGLARAELLQAKAVCALIILEGDHVHLDRCAECRERPFATRCQEGPRILEAEASLPAGPIVSGSDVDHAAAARVVRLVEGRRFLRADEPEAVPFHLGRLRAAVRQVEQEHCDRRARDRIARAEAKRERKRQARKRG